jgi:tetratricopeptide (TPR) repeat protein
MSCLNRFSAAKRFSILAVILCLSGAATVMAAPPDSACPTTVVGTVTGIQIRSTDVGAAPPDQVILIRSSATQPVQKGMPLCAGDHVTVQGDATLVMSLADAADSSADITVYAFATVELTDPRSIFVRIGRMFATLRGVFEARTTRARLGAKGTEFQLEVADKGIEIIQLEGELDFQPLDEKSENSAPNPPSLGAPAFGFQSSFQKKKEPTQKFSTGPAVNLKRLSRLVFVPGGKRPPQVFDADEDTVRKVVDANANAILVSHPSESSRSLIRNFASTEQRARAYREARFRTIWSPENEKYFQLLGNVYVDWAEAQKAVRTYRNAGKGEGSRRDLAIYYNNLGNAYRLAGLPKEADGYFSTALREDPQFAFPYNGMGDVALDLAQAELDRGNISQAMEYLARAEDLYKKSTERSLWGKEGGQNRAIPLFHLGEVALLRAQIAADSTKGDGGKLHLDEASRSFEEALKEAPNYPFARVGLGRTFALRAQVVANSKNRDEANRYLDAARNEYRGVLERDPSFSPAHTAWGDSYGQQGDWKAAAQFYRRATQADPGYPLAYYKTAVALQRLGDAALARNYFSAFLKTESPLMLNGNRAKVSRDAVGAPPSASPPPREDEGMRGKAGPRPGMVMVPSVTGVSLDEAEDRLGHAGLKKGHVRTEKSDAPNGTVFRQQPAAGAEARSDSKVDLWRSSGPLKEVNVPSVVGSKALAASFVLGLYGLRMREQPTESSVERGKIVRQDPPAGARVMQETEIVVYVSSGGAGTQQQGARQQEDTVIVPNVVDHTLDQAKAILEKAGLVYELGSSGGREIFTNTVRRQDPPAGTKISRHSKVVVYLF